MTRDPADSTINTTTDDCSLLLKIGLSKTGVACYECLLKQGHASAADLSAKLSIPRTDLYRSLNILVQIGFITSLKTVPHPTYYQARPLKAAMEHYFQYQFDLVRPMFDEVTIRLVIP